MKRNIIPDQLADLLELTGCWPPPADLEHALQAYVQKCIEQTDIDEAKCIDILTKPKPSIEWEQLGHDFARAIQFANGRESFIVGFMRYK